MITRTKPPVLKGNREATLASTTVDTSEFRLKPSVRKPQLNSEIARRKPISRTKRGFDLIVATVGVVFAAPVIFCLAILILLREGRPIFFISERMKTAETSFNLIKFRTMFAAQDSQNLGVTGGDKANRITPTGRLLRQYRLDELPQVFNVFRGDMSFVGPRPPLRQYTDMFPVTYDAVLQSRPGVTGLATLHYYRHEERLIARSNSAAETEAIYTSRCIPRKAELDLIYQRHASVWFDTAIMWKTLQCVLKR